MVSERTVVFVVVLVEVAFVSDLGSNTAQDNDQGRQGPPAHKASFLPSFLASFGREKASLNTTFKITRLVSDFQRSRGEMTAREVQVGHKAFAASCPGGIVEHSSLRTRDTRDT